MSELSDNPKASCFCATYGRPHLLEEAIESFLRQDYEGPKELIILNDYAGHQLHFAHSEVKIINASKRIIPLGRKFNEVVSYSNGDIFFPWEDDDIYLPWRISYSIAHLKEGIFHTNRAWHDDGGPLLEPEANLFQCNLAVTREKWMEVGGYIDKDVSAIDNDLFRRLGARHSSQAISDNKIFYIYRWAGSGSYHGSAWGGFRQGISTSVEEFIRAKELSGEIPQGRIELEPHWSRDWLVTVANSLEKVKKDQADSRTNKQPNSLTTETNMSKKTTAMHPCHPGFELEESLVIPVPD